jgi:hypothetical protein
MSTSPFPLPASLPPSLPPFLPGKPTHIILVGPCGAGKTALYHQLLFGAVPETVTSMVESEGVDKQKGFRLVGREGGREGEMEGGREDAWVCLRPSYSYSFLPSLSFYLSS